MNHPESIALASQFALLQRRLAALSEENDLLLSQLNRLYDETQSTSTGTGIGDGGVDLSEATQSDLLRHLWLQHQPAQWQFDLRQATICGSNWHHAEPDGRWAGPASRSLLRLPALQAGDYHFSLQVVDAMSEELLAGTRVFIAGEATPSELQFSGHFPAQLTFHRNLPLALDEGLDIEFEFPFMLSPRDKGIADDRILAIRVQSLDVRRQA